MTIALQLLLNSLVAGLVLAVGLLGFVWVRRKHGQAVLSLGLAGDVRAATIPADGDLRSRMARNGTQEEGFITVQDVHFAYADGRPVLNGLSFPFPMAKGSTLAVVGGSGSGKSTLLRLLAGLLPNNGREHHAGRITVGGRTPSEYRRAGGLSFIFQDPTLLDHMTVERNIALPLMTKSARASHAADLRTVMQMVGMKDHAHRLPRELSGGMRTRVSLARAFVNAPEVLLLDEPFSSLDIAWKSCLYGHFMELRARYGTTSILVTHDIHEAAVLADVVLVLGNDGRTAFITPVESPYQGKDRVEHLAEHLKAVYDTVITPVQERLMHGPANGGQPYRDPSTATTPGQA